MADLAHAAHGDTDLHGDPDPRHWAERFASKFVVHGRIGAHAAPLGTPDETESLMLAWFSGAIETGKMVAARPRGTPRDS